MAKSKTIRIDDTERCLAFGEDNDETTKNMLHANLLLAATNRRLYRQCRNYRLKIKLTDPLFAVNNADPPTTEQHAVHYRIYTLSNTWWVKRSIQMAKRVYLQASKAERKMMGGRVAKWNDFVIGTTSAETSPHFTPFSHKYNGLSSGISVTERVVDEGDYVSQIGGDDTEEGNAHKWMFSIDDSLTGNTYNIFDEYALILRQDATVDVRDGPYNELEDIDDAVMDDLVKDGDNPAWDRDDLGDYWTHRATIGHDTNGYLLTSSGLMDCPLGLVWIEKFNGETGVAMAFEEDDPELCAEFAKGSYKGVHAPAY